MGVYTEDNVAIRIEPKTCHFDFDFPKVVDKNLKDEIEFIIKRNESLAEQEIENEISQLLSKSILDYIEYIIKKHNTLPINLYIYTYINRINNRLVLKIKEWYKLELQTPEIMKLFGSTKKLIVKTKYGENVQSLEVVEVVLVQSNLVDYQYQQRSGGVIYFYS